MAEPITTTAASGALLKFFGLPIAAGSIAAAWGFIFLWPRTKGEAFARFSSSIISSAVFGPLLVVWLRSYAPSLFESAKAVAKMYDAEETIGFLFLAAPIMVAAGLPAWWVIGGFVRWFDNRRDKDIGEMLLEVKSTVKELL